MKTKNTPRWAQTAKRNNDKVLRKIDYKEYERQLLNNPTDEGKKDFSKQNSEILHALLNAPTILKTRY